MSKTELFGLIWIGIGLAQLVVGRTLEGFAERSYARSHPDQDLNRYMQRKRRQYWLTAAVTIAAGAALLVYGLMGGRIRGE